MGFKTLHNKHLSTTFALIYHYTHICRLELYWQYIVTFRFVLPLMLMSSAYTNSLSQNVLYAKVGDVAR